MQIILIFIHLNAYVIICSRGFDIDLITSSIIFNDNTKTYLLVIIFSLILIINKV